MVVSAGKIQAVGGRSVPTGATAIDLGDATLLPGFIDAHTHLIQEFNADYNGAALLAMQRAVAETSIRATVNARKTLMAGFTTVRDVGGADFIDVGPRNAINAGVVPRPGMLESVHALGPPAVTATIRRGCAPVSSPASRAPRGGVLSPTDDVDAPQLTQEELNALVNEAHTLCRKTAAHAHGAEAAKRAIRAGIDSIEHGTFLDDEAMRMMHDKGIFFVPTLTTRVGLAESKFPPLVQARAELAVKQQDIMVRRTVALGVRIALGTEAEVFPHGENALEFACMAADGLTAAQSLQAGTSSAVELLGMQEKRGRLNRDYLPILWPFPVIL